MSLSAVKHNLPDAHSHRARSRRLVIVVLAVLSLALAACGTTAPAEPAAPATSVAAGPVAGPATVTPLPPAPTALPAPTQAPTAVPPSPSVQVIDQPIVEDRVLIAEVVSAGPGWVVVHADNGGLPGPVLGYSPVSDGSNRDVFVPVDTSSATPTLYAMLHSDAGTIGAYEFPGADAPVVLGGLLVSPAFRVTGGLTAQAPAPTATTAAPAPTAVPTRPIASATVTGQVLAGEAEVEMEDMQFRPQTLTIRVGTRVKFGNRDRVQHTATSDTGVFDSGYLSKGQEFYYTFTQPGTYPYYCIPHGGPGGVGMSGVIVVVP